MENMLEKNQKGKIGEQEGRDEKERGRIEQ